MKCPEWRKQEIWVDYFRYFFNIEENKAKKQYYKCICGFTFETPLEDNQMSRREGDGHIG